MPPPGAPRPDEAAYRSLVESIETTLDAAAEAAPNPGRVPVHRLNRTEYTNAVRDLLALEVDGRSLIADEPDSHGFDNVASVLTVSPALLESYLSAASTVSRLAVGDPSRNLVVDTFKVPTAMVQDDRANERQPFGSRGGTAIRYHFPLDGDYSIKVVLKRQLYLYLIGMGEPHQIDLRLDGTLLKRFTIGGEGKGLTAPESFAGNTQGDPGWEVYMHTADSRPRGPRAGQGWDRAKSACRSCASTGNPRACCSRRSAASPGRPTSSTSANRAWTRCSSAVRTTAAARRTRRAAGRSSSAVRLRRSSRTRVGGAVREAHPLDAGASRLPAAGHRRRSEHPARFLQGGPRRWRFRPGHPARAAPHPVGAGVPVSSRARRPSTPLRAGLPAGPRDTVQTRPDRSRIAAVVLPLEQHPGRRAARPGGAWDADRSGGARAPGQADAARCAFAGTRGQLRQPVAEARAPRGHRPRRGRVPGLRREPARGPAAGDAPVCREPAARGSQRRGPHRRELHVRQRAAGAPLRDPEHLRQPLPPRDPRGRRSRRTARPGEHPDGHVVPESHVARASRTLAAREPARRPAAGAAARCSRLAGERRGRRAALGARAPGGPPQDSELRDLPRADGSARLLARELRRARPVANDERRRPNRRIRGAA